MSRKLAATMWAWLGRAQEGARAPASPDRSRFRRDIEAVSPVISTILMVAITVVLAATAFVLVADVGGNTTQSAPAIGFLPEEFTGRLKVTAAQPNADWNRLAVSLKENSGGGTIYVGSDPVPLFSEAASATGGVVAEGVRVDLATTYSAVAAGDYLEFCRSGGSAQPIEVTLVDVEANQVLGDYKIPLSQTC